ncbi:MAG: type II toxin-antitoxin system RelE/ParE family toxin [Clostridiales bacterium]|nr:type II toxin-antitoxin system RelE/ParE family toxin [Clostridiales bacterium]
MSWEVKYIKEAKEDLNKLDHSLVKQVLKGIVKVSKNPLPLPDGYGKPLGNKGGNNLTGFFKIKYRSIGIRVVYTLVREEGIMNIIVISKRDDEYCYEAASKLYNKYGDEIFEDLAD